VKNTVIKRDKIYQERMFCRFDENPSAKLFKVAISRIFGCRAIFTLLILIVIPSSAARV
jgi:hypothetical protein